MDDRKKIGFFGVFGLQAGLPCLWKVVLTWKDVGLKG